jgi:1,4-alpha-glucan branching enzyme
LPGQELPSAGGRSGLGANQLADGQVLFGLYHPTAARVFVAGTFNDWQHPGQQRPDPGAFVELDLYRGWFGAANTWLAVTERAGVGAEYRFWVQGGTPPEDAAGGPLVVDPYARCLGPDARRNDAEVVDPTTFAWSDQRWRTPDPAGLILYEVSVHCLPTAISTSAGPAGPLRRVEVGVGDGKPGSRHRAETVPF